MGIALVTIFVVIFGVVTKSEAEGDVFLSNVDKTCLKCLCIAASNCNLDGGCHGTFCGPFHMSYVYYSDATDNTPMTKTENAYKECAKDYECAQRVVKYYIGKHARDCNDDGVTDCTDFAMIHFNGAYNCGQNMFRNSEGTVYAGKFFNCTGY